MGKKVTLFGCDQCPLTYKYRCNLKRHVKKCHVPNGHPCPHCPCTYEKVSERDSHIKIHNNNSKIISGDGGGQASTSSLSISDELNIHSESCFSTKTNVQKNNRNGLNHQRSHLKLRKVKDRNYDVIPRQNVAVTKIRKKQTSLSTTHDGCVTSTNRFIEALQKSNDNSTTDNIVKLVFLPKNRKSLKQQFNSLIPIGTGNNLVYQVPEPHSDDEEDDNMLTETTVTNENNDMDDNMDFDEDHITQETNSIPNNSNNHDDENENEVVPNMEEEEEEDYSPVENDDDDDDDYVSNEIQEKKKSTKRKERSTKNKKPIVQKPLQRRYRKAVHLCPVCNHAFTCKTTLRVHIAEHPGEKPWHCDECWFSFRFQPEIYQHKRWHHVPNGKFRCTFCTCSFDKETVFKRHMNLENLRQGVGDGNNIVKHSKLPKKTKTDKKKDKPKKVKIPKEPTEKKKRGRKKKIINFDKEQSKENLSIMPKLDTPPIEVFVGRRTGRKRTPKTKH